MQLIRIKGINVVRKRQSDGTVRVHRYHRATGYKLVGEPGSPQFLASIAEAEKSKLLSMGGTLSGLIRKYQVSAEFAKLAESTQAEYRRLLSRIEVEFGDMPFAAVSHSDARVVFLDWRDANAAKLREAENRLTILAAVLSWGVDRGLLSANVLKGWRRTYQSDRSDRIWTFDQVDRFMERASAEMRLVMTLALFTGQRQADLLNLRWADYRSGTLYLRQRKGRVRVAIPCIPLLREMLDARQRALAEKPLFDLNATILVAERGAPWRKRHFSRQFNVVRDDAAITDLHFHDLRGTAVSMLSEAGCSEAEIAAITGHTVASVSQILRKYRAQTTLPARQAITKLGNYLATDFANRLQTVASVQGSDPSEGR